MEKRFEVKYRNRAGGGTTLYLETFEDVCNALKRRYTSGSSALEAFPAEVRTCLMEPKTGRIHCYL